MDKDYLSLVPRVDPAIKRFNIVWKDQLATSKEMRYMPYVVSVIGQGR